MNDAPSQGLLLRQHRGSCRAHLLEEGVRLALRAVHGGGERVHRGGWRRGRGRGSRLGRAARERRGPCAAVGHSREGCEFACRCAHDGTPRLHVSGAGKG